MENNVVKLPWVSEVKDQGVWLSTSDFEEMRDWALRINQAYLTMVEENLRLRRAISELSAN